MCYNIVTEGGKTEALLLDAGKQSKEASCHELEWLRKLSNDRNFFRGCRSLGDMSYTSNEKINVEFSTMPRETSARFAFSLTRPRSKNKELCWMIICASLVLAQPTGGGGLSSALCSPMTPYECTADVKGVLS